MNRFTRLATTALTVILTTALTTALVACKADQQPEAAAASAANNTASKPPALAAAQADAKTETPALKIAMLDGKLYDLTAHRGRWVVVNFWATWCAPCLKEMPALDAYDSKREDLDVIGLAYEDTTPAEMRAFLRKRPVHYAIAIVDTYNPPPDFPTPRGLPMTYLIAPDGHIAKEFMGPITGDNLDAAIAAQANPSAAKAG